VTREIRIRGGIDNNGTEKVGNEVPAEVGIREVMMGNMPLETAIRKNPAL
jgi:hypothetical protein